MTAGKMKALTGGEIRSKFIAYFESKGHTHVASSSLVPYNDATLLFTNAGMVQFKDVFLGLEKRPYTRAVTSQRCVRAGGKHNDLDTVGKTARHHTFFEMLGNFSFGDYFKEDAITYAWEFITEVLALDKEKLYVTVFEEDDEAAALWEKISHLDKERIFRIGAEDNFWAMGDTGPCGPCSEIFYDRGPEHSCDAPICGIGHCDCDRYMEMWNLVFMQYNRDEEGVLTPLPRPSIDTGMGLERVAAILQEVDSNYDTDLFDGIMAGISQLAGKSYDPGPAGFPFRVIADHSRSCSFLISDGVMPSNEGRGYVLRRILRRAARFGRSLGLKEPFLYKLVPCVADSLDMPYPELKQQAETVAKVIRLEEERFQITLHDGLAIAEGMIAKAEKEGKGIISGKDAFTLYDTYGFPLDLTRDIGEEHHLTVDEEGFNQAMAHQRELAKKARKGAGGGEELTALGQSLASYAPTRFLGYQQTEAEGEILALLTAGNTTEKASAGEEGWLVLNQTPFYGESGGQTGDTGEILGANEARMEIKDTQKLANDVFAHRFAVLSGTFAPGQAVQAKINLSQRAATAANHSATHLLHKALRKVLGDHVQQSGSFVDQERLRFDFSHFAPLTPEELNAVEDEINRNILRDMTISSQELPIEEAKAQGAMAFFGDKYGDTVRMISIGDYSKELCGGTHCRATGEIGFVKILSENGIAAGMRRIEMLTAFNALNYYKEQEEKVEEIAAALKTTPQEAISKAKKLMAELKEKNREIEQLKARFAQDSLTDMVEQAREIKGVKMLAAQVPAIDDMAALRELMDVLRHKHQLDVVLLGANAGEKAVFVAACNDKAQEQGFHAGRLVKHVAAVCGGSGGGRGDMAQAGGKDTSKLPEAIEAAWEFAQA